MNANALEDIKNYAMDYAEKANALKRELEAMNRETAVIQQDHLKELTVLAAEAAAAQKLVEIAILENKGLFANRKTLEVAGVKFGLTKTRDKYVVADEADAIRYIKEKMSDKAIFLINNKETIAKTALANLTATELKKLGVTVEKGLENAMVKLADDSVERFIAESQKQQAALL